MYDAMEGTTVIVCDTLTHTGPRCLTRIQEHPVQVYVQNPCRVLIEKKTTRAETQVGTSSQAVIRICSPYTHPWGTNQTAERLQRNSPNSSVDSFKRTCTDAAVNNNNNKHAFRIKVYKRKADLRTSPPPPASGCCSLDSPCRVESPFGKQEQAEPRRKHGDAGHSKLQVQPPETRRYTSVSIFAALFFFSSFGDGGLAC